MEHYVAYHSASVMGHMYGDTGPAFHFLSGKSELQLRRAVGQTVWVIASDMSSPRRYFLAGAYTPSEVVPEDGVWAILGSGDRLVPQVEVTSLAWFQALRREQNNFSYGFNRIRSPEIIEALKRYSESSRTEPTLPEELSVPHQEGFGKRVTVNKYERDNAARAECLRHFGAVCYVCKTDLAQVYGEVAAGLVHVHHLVPLSTIGREYTVDPKKDLIPICPNCHAVAHRSDPPLSPEQIRESMRNQRSALVKDVN